MRQRQEDRWRSEINRVQARRGAGHNKLRTYRTFKQDFEPEHYVRQLLSRAHRSALAKFRCGTAPLKIETGRYEGLPLESRTCFMCPGVVESEQHVLMSCPLYEDLRADLFVKALSFFPDFNVMADDTRFQLLLSNEHLVQATAKTCRLTLDRRFTFIYRQ